MNCIVHYFTFWTFRLRRLVLVDLGYQAPELLLHGFTDLKKNYRKGGKQKIVQKPHFNVHKCLDLEKKSAMIFLLLFCKYFKGTLSKNPHKILIHSIIFIHLKPLNPPFVDTECLLSFTFMGDVFRWLKSHIISFH